MLLQERGGFTKYLEAFFPPLTRSARGGNWELPLSASECHTAACQVEQTGDSPQTLYKNRLINGMHCRPCLDLLMLQVATAKIHFEEQVLVTVNKQKQAG